MSQLLQNALYFPKRDFYLTSRHVHDYRVYKYYRHHKMSTDGGTCYLHRTVVPPEHAHLVVPFDLTTDDTYQTICDKLLWGSLPLDKTKPQVHVFRPISTLTKDHLRAIVANVPDLNPLHHVVIRHWLKTDRDQTPL